MWDKEKIVRTIKIASTTTDEAMMIYPYIRFCFVSLSCMSIESVPCWAPGPPMPLIDWSPQSLPDPSPLFIPS